MIYPRKIYPFLKKESNNKNIVVLTGSRQTGKTTLLHALEQDFKKQGKSTLFLDLDLVENLEHFISLESFLNYLKINGLDLKKPHYIFVDEFQHAPDPTKILKNFYDHYPNFKIYASGSSSLEMADHLKESLAGRKSVYHLHPLSFEEFLVFKQEKEFLKYLKNWQKDLNLSPKQNEQIWHLLEEFLIFGGYPKVVLSKSRENKIQELRDIFNSYIRKDIKGFLKLENIISYNKLIEFLALNIGNLANLFKISSELSLTREIIEKYLFLLEETFVIKLVRPYFKNKKKEIIKMPKVYFEDLGLRNLALQNFNSLSRRLDAGFILENYVLGEIAKANLSLYKLNFWRRKMGAEVDFIFQNNTELIPIEVKYQNFNQKKLSTPSGLKSFVEEYNVSKAAIINNNLSLRKKLDKTLIDFVPHYFISQWLKI